MKKIIALMVIATFLSGCAITIPYFDDMEPEYLCGNFSEKCQPTSSQKWSLIKGGVDYNGNVNHFLGRSYDSFFETEKCIQESITESDLDVSGVNIIYGTLKSSEKTNFSNQISANIIELVTELGGVLPPDLKVDLTSEIKRTVDENNTSAIQLEYKRVDMDKDFMDANLGQCLNSIPPSLSVATGMSVITVSGAFTSEQITDSMAKVEAKASFMSLTDDMKAKYTQAKTRILNGEFEPLSFIFAIAYRNGKSES